MAEEEKNEKSQKGGKPTLTPEQEAEAAAKKAARAEAKAKGVKAPRGGGAPAIAVAQERVKREAPPLLRKLYDAEVRQKLLQEFSLKNRMQAPRLSKITI